MSTNRSSPLRRRRLAATCLAVLASFTAISRATEYPVRTKGSSKVQIIEQEPLPETSGGTSGGPGHVIAKYSDLLQKAIAYKAAHPGDTVEVRFVTYRMSRDLYVGFNPSASTTYLKVSNTDFAGADSEKLIYSFCKAAQAGIIVKMIIHKAGESAVTLDDITDYLDTNGGANLTYKIVTWGDSSDDQMHNKFLLINKLRSGSTDSSSLVYTTSANVDEWKAYGPKSSKRWQQTGMLVYDNSGLYNAYKKYFDDGLWACAEVGCTNTFRETMTTLHAASGGLNYAEDADGISAYFYPVPIDPAHESNSYFWSTTFNPTAKILHLINTGSGISAPYVKLNQGFYRRDSTEWDEFGDKFIADLNTMAARFSIDLTSSTVSNVRCVVMDFNRHPTPFDTIASNRIALGAITSTTRSNQTHSKNATFAFTQSGTAHYYSSGGSTNAKYNDFVLKANNILMIHEVGSANKELYEDMKTVFENIFNYTFTP